MTVKNGILCTASVALPGSVLQTWMAHSRLSLWLTNWGVFQLFKGTDSTDTECKPCPPGTFSPEESYDTSCIPHTV